MENFKLWADLVNSWMIPAIFLFITLYAYLKKVKVYEVFVEGAKEGFNVAVMIIPYLVVIFVAIFLFRSSGALDMLSKAIGYLVPPSIFPQETILLALMKPLSGSGARGIMVDIFQQHGPDSFIGFLASTIQGSTETTFYVIAVYFGAVGVKRTRYTVPVGLAAEFIAIVVATIVTHLWFL